MTPRALRYRDHATGRPVGRPRRPRAEAAAVFGVVARLVVERPGLGEPALHRMRPELPLKEVRRALHDVKDLIEERDEIQRKRRRVTVVVLHPGVMGSDDETHFGRDDSGAAVRGKAIRDPGSREIVDAAVGRPTRQEDVISAMERVKAAKGGLFLVHSTDNGKCFTGSAVSAYRRANFVVHLPNLPRTPQHNAYAERAIGEIKRACGPLEEEVLRGGIEAVRERVAWAVHDLNHNRPRRCLGWRTPSAVAAERPPAYTVVSREHFYWAACNAKERAVHGLEDPRAIRMAEREAVYQTLQFFGLVVRYRGGREIPTWNAEAFS